MDNETLDIEEVADIGEYPLEPEYEDIVEDLGEEDNMGSKIIDHTVTFNKLGGEKVTRPILTKYEKIKLIGIRTQQLARGCPATVKVGKLRDVRKIAEKELEEKTIPLIIRRYLPDGSYEDWQIHELIVPTVN